MPLGNCDHPAFVLWFTGLSGSGKSTLAEKLYHDLKAEGRRVEHLDGDAVRSVFPQTGFSRDERNMHIKRIGYLASILERNGIIVLASFVSPYREARDFVRGLCCNFIEVFVSASIESCKQRDPKGLYRRALAGEIRQFTGIDDPYETPEHPELTIQTDTVTLDQSYRALRDYIDQRMTGN